MKDTVHELPQILIVDKKGFLGEKLTKKLVDNLSLIYISERKPNSASNQLKYIVYKKKFPEIPYISYSHIIVIYNGENEVKAVFKELIKAAEDIKAKIIFVVPYAYYREDFFEKLIDSYSRVYVLVLGDIFDSSFLFDPLVPSVYAESDIIQLLKQVYNKRKIFIPGEGIDVIYPIHVEDVILKIIDIAFKTQGTSRIFCLFPKHPLTFLALARILQKIDPLLKVDFYSRQNTKSLTNNKEIPANGEFITENIDLKKSFEELSLLPAKKKIVINKKNRKNFLFPAIFIFLFAIFSPFFFMLVFLFLGGYNLKSSAKALSLGDFVTSGKKAYLSKVFFKWAKGFSNVVIFESNRFSNLIDEGSEVSSAVVSFTSSSQYFLELFTKQGNTTEENFIKASNNLKSTLITFQKIKAENESEIKKFIPDELLEEKSFDLIGSFASAILDVSPNLFGFEGEKKYLLLFQNNMELRPGGGFIGSYGLITIKKGRITDFTINDVYDADGQLKGHVEPPYPIRRYLPSVHWYLRDSNFDIDFLQNASHAAYFLNVEKGENVDGVIGIDITFVKEILKTIGPVYVSDYNENVTADNLYLLTQSHVEKDFFPGSTQKKNFLRSLFNSIILTFESKNDSDFNKGELYFKLLESFSRSILQKHLIFAFSDKNIQNLFTTYNISSSLFDPRKNNVDTFNDFVGINEANIGINKVNYLIKRKVDQTVNISEKGSIDGKLTINYKNLSTQKSLFGGDYKNYLRLILPLNTKITSISIDGKEQKIVNAITDPKIYEAKKFLPPKGLEVEITEEQGKTVIGFLVIVEKEALKTISVNYLLPYQIDQKNKSLFYNLRFFKQPGTEEYPFSFNLYYPKFFKAINLSKNLKKIENKIWFSETLFEDKTFNVDFSKD